MNIKWITPAFIFPLAVCAPLAGAALLTDDPAVKVVPVESRPTPVERWITQHDCWSGEAPPDMVGQVPGHVVVTVDGELRWSVGKVGPALEQIFDGVDHGLVVHAFCR